VLKDVTRYLSTPIDAILAACELIPRLNGMVSSGALTDEHRSINRCHIGVVNGALREDLNEWRRIVVRMGAAKICAG
jgi:acetylornithine deacetylase